MVAIKPDEISSIIREKIENYDAKRKELRYRLREAEEDVKAAQAVRREFEHEGAAYTEDMDKFYNAISAEGNEAQKGRIRQKL